MKKLTSKWKLINKKGLKLSLICGLNWLVWFVAKSQFYLFSAAFLGLMTYYLPQDYRVATINLIELVLLFKIIFDFLSLIKYFSRIKLLLLDFALWFGFTVIVEYVLHHAISEHMFNNIGISWIISVVYVSLLTIFQPKLFQYYVLKNVINKKYLGIRELTDALPPEINLYTDAAEADANKRMRQINQNVIKEPYQDIVELSFLNREVITGIHYKIEPFPKENERIFEDVDTIYYPIFKVYPFGIEEDFGHTLIKFKLSRKAAFTVTGESALKKDF